MNKARKLMSDPEQKPTTQDSSLSEDLLQFYKDFASFNDFHACFCDALAGEATDNEVMDTGTIQGLTVVAVGCSTAWKSSERGWKRYRINPLPVYAR